MISDFFIILYWWFWFFLLGTIGLPLAFLFFRKFFDFGFLFSKVLAILILGYSVWLIASLQILPFTKQTIWLCLLFFAILNFLVFKRNLPNLKEEIFKRKSFLIFEEILFFGCLVFWSFVRGFQPAIEGLEKFMDFGFVNAILKSKFFPPYDMWMSGKTINYYYFGHYIAAFLTKLSGLDSAFTYNLMIATIFAFCFSLSFSLIFNLIYHWEEKKNLKKIIALSLLGAFLVSLGGNLHPLWYFLKNKFSFEGYWYPDATRFVEIKFGAKDSTIHEFPAYSFVVADLHAHLSDVPFVLLFLGLLFALFLTKEEKTFLPILSLNLGVMLMTNTWDFPIYFLLLSFFILFYFPSKNKFFETLKKSFSFLIFCFFLSLLFLINYKYEGGGIGFVKTRTPFFPHLLVLWGYQWFFGFLFLGVLIFSYKSNFSFKESEIFVAILIIVATILILIPEIVYHKEIYGPPYERSNTMFKLVYQAFILYALSVPFAILFLTKKIKNWFLRIPFFAISLLFLSFVSIYPYFAITSYYGKITKIKEYKGIYGLNFLRDFYPQDYEAILWLKDNLKEPIGVLEAAGDSFTDFNRVSAVTGLPTIQGWLVHEWLWRGSFDEVGKRAEEVQRVYETTDEKEALEILRKYRMEYVFLGEKENQKYQVEEKKFSKIGEIVFSSGQTKIYKIK